MNEINKRYIHESEGIKFQDGFVFKTTYLDEIYAPICKIDRVQQIKIERVKNNTYIVVSFM